MSLEYFTPDEVPPEIKAYEAELLQLQPGKAGKLGALKLSFQREPSTNKTVIKDQFNKVPLFSMKALYLEESMPSMAYIYIMSPSGGVLQGDRYGIELNLSKGAQVHATTQGSTRIYRMDKNYATQMVKINVDEGCYLEYIPDQIIPYKNSRFYQTSDIIVHENGNLVYSEIIVPGRVASGESFEYDICYMKTQAKDQNGALRFTDVFMLEPKKTDLRNLGLLGEHSVFASVYILSSQEKTKEILKKLNERFKENVEVLSGATVLPKGRGVLVRMLGDYAEDVKKVIYGVVEDARKILIGASFSGIRKY
jgi:urease accessory protein